MTIKYLITRLYNVYVQFYTMTSYGVINKVKTNPPLRNSLYSKPVIDARGRLIVHKEKLGQRHPFWKVFEREQKSMKKSPVTQIYTILIFFFRLSVMLRQSK